jgi:hypothetical protein
MITDSLTNELTAFKMNMGYSPDPTNVAAVCWLIMLVTSIFMAALV